jgi:hypothetical protein
LLDNHDRLHAIQRPADRCRDPARPAAYVMGVSRQYLMLNSFPRDIAGGSPPDHDPRVRPLGGAVSREAVTRVVF